jgi:hypothetical protein
LSSFLSAKDLRNEFLRYYINNVLNNHYQCWYASENAVHRRQDHLVISHLLNDKTVEIDLSGAKYGFWLGCSDCSLAHLLENISISAPNLEKLSFSYSSWTVPRTSPFSQVKKPMKKLRFLTVLYRGWSDHDLDLMTLFVPNLERLEVCIKLIFNFGLAY